MPIHPDRELALADDASDTTDDAWAHELRAALDRPFTASRRSDKRILIDFLSLPDCAADVRAEESEGR